jgi:hypothetical protein
VVDFLNWTGMPFTAVQLVAQPGQVNTNTEGGKVTGPSGIPPMCFT